MTLGASSRAAATAVGIENVTFAPTATVKKRKVLIFGTYDPTKTSVVADTPIPVLNSTDVGNRCGFGFPISYVARWFEKGSNGIEMWICPQAQAGGGTAATGSIDFGLSTATVSGTVHLYIGGEYVPVNVSKGATATNIATATAAAINANKHLPVTASAASTVVTVTAKDASTFGNGVDISLNLGFKQESVPGVAASITGMSGGAGVPSLTTALANVGSGDNQNFEDFTAFVHTYDVDTTALEAFSAYNGEGDTFTGNYDKKVSRPVRVLAGDVVAGSGGYSTVTALGVSYKDTDRTNGIVSVPGSPNHPSAVAAVAIGVMELANNTRAEEHYTSKILPGILPGALVDQWTANYDNRNAAVESGISPTKVVGTSVQLQNVVTFFNPDSIAPENNIYSSMRNISITQNILAGLQSFFGSTRYQGITLVADVTKVSNTTSRQKVKDTAAVKDDVDGLAEEFEANAWLFESQFTKDNATVSLRALSNGLLITFPCIYSIQNDITDVGVQADLSTAILF